MEFVSDGNIFFSCNDLVARDSSDKNIMAWDFEMGVVVSNQIYQVYLLINFKKLAVLSIVLPFTELIYIKL